MNVLLWIVFSFCVGPSLSDESPCKGHLTCGTCLSSLGGDCVWCSEPNITGRCQSTEYYTRNKNWCRKNLIEIPKVGNFDKNSDEPLRGGNATSSAVQFRPQKITVKLRPGGNITFPVSFKHAKHFPLDVYYLMDYSYTMDNYVKALKAQSEKIQKALTGFTNNVRFGLGSFVEKPAYPFVGKEHSAYVYRHHLNITSNITLFGQSLVKKENFSNYDQQEAGLDALMQVMACDEKLGWRSNANRIIVLCTDAPYHSAGDGKMVLAYNPNDMKCHLNNSGYYDYGLKQDYPSVSQISTMAKRGKFKIIFASVKKDVKDTYDALAQAIEAESALLDNSKPVSSIVDIIKQSYLESVRYMTLTHRFPSFVQFTLSPDCTRPRLQSCALGHEKELKMTATLKVTSCPDRMSGYRYPNLVLSPVGGGLNDKLEIDLEVINCQCVCEQDKTIKPNSELCNKFGSYQCGICACNKDRSGDKCECDESTASKTDLDECRNVNETRFCSGRGTCRCGKCICYAGFSGNFCEFDDNSCMRKDGLLCSGHGMCTLGACSCDGQWAGEDCGCSALEHSCFAPYSEQKCSGNGKCVCNKCECDKVKNKAERYSGVFCEDCEDCAQKRCTELEKYARCNYQYNKTHCDEKHEHTYNTDVQMLNKSEINTSKWPTSKLCTTKLDGDKTMVFVHYYDENEKKLVIILQNEIEEAPRANIWLPVGIAIGSVVLIGLLTVLAWKLLVDAMDAREYRQFEERLKRKGIYEEIKNPLFQSAFTNFSNPAYNEATATTTCNPQMDKK